MELHPQALVWFKAPDAMPKGYLLLSANCEVAEITGRQRGIRVSSSSGRSLSFRVPNTTEHAVWFSTIADALLARRDVS